VRQSKKAQARAPPPQRAQTRRAPGTPASAVHNTSAQAGVPVPQKALQKVAVHVQDRADFTKADKTHVSCTQPIANLPMACV
jgi:hypothetical protein